MVAMMGRAARLGLLAALCWPLLADAQQPTDKAPPPKQESSTPKKPDSTQGLEEMLATALKHNPDIRVAEAKVREAEAELSRIRLQVSQKVTTYRHQLEARKRLVFAAEQEVSRLHTLRKKGFVPEGEVAAGEAALFRAKTDLASLEAELPYLLGRAQETKVTASIDLRGNVLSGSTLTLAAPPVSSVAFSPDGTLFSLMTDGSVRVWDATTGKPVLSSSLISTAAAPPLADKIRKALDTPINVDFKEVEFLKVLQDLTAKAVGLSFQTSVNWQSAPLGTEAVTLRLDNVPLGAVFQALEDRFPDQTALGGPPGLRILVRDYGILITLSNRAPARAMSVHEFWKGPAATKPAAEKK